MYTCHHTLFFQSKVEVIERFSEPSLLLIPPFSRMLTVENPARDEVASQWLRNKSRTELWALVQHGNPQEIVPYSIALTSQLNQVVCQHHISSAAARNDTLS